MNTCTLAVVVSLGFLGQANPDPELEDLVRQATEAHEAALEAMPRAKGQGRYEYTLKRSSVDGEIILHTSGDYSFAYSGEKNWGSFVKSPGGEYDATVYVSDPKSVMIGYFSDAFIPLGARGKIVGLTDLYELPSELLCPPQAMTYAWAFFRLGKGTFGENHVKTLQKVDDLYVIQFEKEDVTRFHIDPNKAFHLVRYECLTLDGHTKHVVTKDWRTTEGGLWYVRDYHTQRFPNRAMKNYESRRLTLDSIEPNVNIPPDVFTVDALGLPVGARIKDTRVKPNVTFRALPPWTDMAALERVIGELPGRKKD